jgi:hypothetical protein
MLGVDILAGACLARPPPPDLGAVINGSSGSRPARLAFALSASFVAILALRGVGVLWHNSAGPDPDYLRGFTADGRYYPVDGVCPVLDHGALEDAVGHGGELTAEATTFEAREYHVLQGSRQLIDFFREAAAFSIVEVRFRV